MRDIKLFAHTLSVGLNKHFKKRGREKKREIIKFSKLEYPVIFLDHLFDNY